MARSMMEDGRYTSCFYLANKIGDKMMAKRALEFEARRFLDSGLRQEAERFSNFVKAGFERGNLDDIGITQIEVDIIKKSISEEKDSSCRLAAASENAGSTEAFFYAKAMTASLSRLKNTVELAEKLMRDWPQVYREDCQLFYNDPGFIMTYFIPEGFYKKLSVLIEDYNRDLQKKIINAISVISPKMQEYPELQDFNLSKIVNRIVERLYGNSAESFENPRYMESRGLEGLQELFGIGSGSIMPRTDFSYLYESLNLLQRFAKEKNTDKVARLLELLETCARTGSSIGLVVLKVLPAQSQSVQTSLDRYTKILRHKNE